MHASPASLRLALHKLLKSPVAAVRFAVQAYAIRVDLGHCILPTTVFGSAGGWLQQRLKRNISRRPAEPGPHRTGRHRRRLPAARCRWSYSDQPGRASHHLSFLLRASVRLHLSNLGRSDRSRIRQQVQGHAGFKSSRLDLIRQGASRRLLRRPGTDTVTPDGSVESVQRRASVRDRRGSMQPAPPDWKTNAVLLIPDLAPEIEEAQTP
jgi:hypothetical protein